MIGGASGDGLARHGAGAVTGDEGERPARPGPGLYAVPLGPPAPGSRGRSAPRVPASDPLASPGAPAAAPVRAR